MNEKQIQKLIKLSQIEMLKCRYAFSKANYQLLIEQKKYTTLKQSQDEQYKKSKSLKDFNPIDFEIYNKFIGRLSDALKMQAEIIKHMHSKSQQCVTEMHLVEKKMEALEKIHQAFQQKKQAKVDLTYEQQLNDQFNLNHFKPTSD